MTFLNASLNLPSYSPSYSGPSYFKRRYTFKNPTLLSLALLHRSASEPDNTSLAWLGDAALQLVITEQLAALEGHAGAKKLTDSRKVLVSREQCAACAKAIGLEKLITVGRSLAAEVAERRGKKIYQIRQQAVAEMLNANILGEAFEAILGAIYVDGGLDAVRDSYTRAFPTLTQELVLNEGEM